MTDEQWERFDKRMTTGFNILFLSVSIGIAGWLIYWVVVENVAIETQRKEQAARLERCEKARAKAEKKPAECWHEQR